ncbi:MAG: calcium/sodium antiporter [Desulfobacteraceae bacterium]|nr:calcium/sodium antiporter [Desulfobacteraceae bacterium]MBC2756158.1 calcium/sodium antiporter [Desulfobacteraceae bacterium]
MILQYVLLVVGFVMLYYGAEWLVKGSASLARSLGITPIVIGLTVVAFGTSAPELVVSVIASIQNKSMIAVGNVVGSNICNIALVLGMASFLMPITADRSVVKRDIPLMLIISVYLLLISLNSEISRIEGVTLFGGVILYTVYNYYLSTREFKLAQAGAGSVIEGEAEAELDDIGFVESRAKQIAFIVVGIACVVIGAQVLIDAAVIVMKKFGVDEKFIGLTIVAFGTSLPELATSVVAAMRKQMDISIGNLIGSNVFNILSVIGAASMIRPIPITGGFIESGLIIDYGVMMLVSFLPLVMMWKDSIVSRKDGVVLLCCYIGYLSYLVYKS